LASASYRQYQASNKIFIIVACLLIDPKWLPPLGTTNIYVIMDTVKRDKKFKFDIEIL
jgi:hypothetical protein